MPERPPATGGDREAREDRSPSTATATAPATARRRIPGSPVAGLGAALVVGVGGDDVERVVELDVDLAAVVEGDLDLVGAVLVAGLGLGHLAAARLGERRGAGAVE